MTTIPSHSDWYTEASARQLIGGDFPPPWIPFLLKHLNLAFHKGRQIGYGQAELQADPESHAEQKQRIRKIKVATAQGCLAAALGQPLHTVADSGHAPRSYEGDAWEHGWEFINGSATWQSRLNDLDDKLRKLIRKIEELKDELREAGIFPVGPQQQEPNDGRPGT